MAAFLRAFWAFSLRFRRRRIPCSRSLIHSPWIRHSSASRRLSPRRRVVSSPTARTPRRLCPFLGGAGPRAGFSMTLRFNSLKTRTALAMSAVIVAILLANALYLILTKRAELRRGIEDRALTFALLTRAPICTGYETYKDSGFAKFRELMRDLLTLDPDVVRIAIMNVDGQVLYDTASLNETGAPAAAEAPKRWVQEPERLAAGKRLEDTGIPG